MPEPPLSPRMELLLTAALHVVAEHGLRGLTHRAVDREAGLPEGSCSAYLRTRKALVLALTEYVADSLTADVEGLAADLTACALGDDAGRRGGDRRSSCAGSTSASCCSRGWSCPSRPPATRSWRPCWRRSGSRLIGLVESILSARGKDHGDGARGDAGGVVRRRAARRPAEPAARASGGRSSASRWRS